MTADGIAETLAEIEALETNTLRPVDVATYLHSCPNTISNAAKLGLLPWAYKLGTRTVIPKEAFIFYHKYGQVFKDRPIANSEAAT